MAMLNSQMVVVKDLRTRSIFFISAVLRDLNEQGTLMFPPSHHTSWLEAQYPCPPVYHPCAFSPWRSTAREPQTFHRAPDAAFFSDAPRLVYHVRNPGRCRLEGSCGCCGCWKIQLGNSYIMSSLCHHYVIMLHCINGIPWNTPSIHQYLSDKYWRYPIWSSKRKGESATCVVDCPMPPLPPFGGDIRDIWSSIVPSMLKTLALQKDRCAWWWHDARPPVQPTEKS